MLKLVCSAGAVVLLSGAAVAADLPVYEAPPVEAVAPAYDWTGIYIGAHGGYSWGEADLGPLGTVGNFDGGLVGGQLGVNWQWNMWVLGLEGDGSWQMADTAFVTPGGAVVNVEEEWTASLRGRVGVAFDRFLVYGTGGAGWVEVDASVAGLGSASNTHFGWVAGGGVEAMVTQNIVVGVEYLHADYDSEAYTIAGVTVTGEGDTDVIRGRVSWKFGSLFAR